MRPEPIPTTSMHRSAFDKAAITYDDDFERLPATRWLRRRVWQTYYKYFHAGDALLELNCGTGSDAMELASNGIYVLATDASEVMLRETDRKIHATGLHRYIQTQQVTFQRLNVLRDKRFDGAYSNFGGLNCTRQLDDVAFNLSVLVKPHGYLVLCIMSRFSIWESMSFGIRGKFRKAFRRHSKSGTLADVHGEKVWVHYYSPNDVQKLFAHTFDVVEVYGLNVFTPPPTSRRANKLLSPILGLLASLDSIVAGVKPFRNIGDHFVIVLQRKN